MRNNRYKNVLAIAVVTATLLAIAGLIFINTGPVEADNVGLSGLIKTDQITSSDKADSNQGVMPMALPFLAKMASALILVVLGIYVALYLLKRIMGGRHSGNGRNDLIELLQTVHISPKKTVSLIRVADRSVLIGVAEGQISPLAELDASETAAILEREVHIETKDSFSRMLDSALNKIRQKALKPRSDPVGSRDGALASIQE